MKYYPALAVRTDFSLGESIIGVNDLAAIAQSVGTDVIGVTDTMSVSSMVEATKSLAKKDIKLLTGVRIRVVMEADKEATPLYLKLYPVNEDGMKSIYRLLTRSFLEDRFYYVPRVTWDDIRDLVSDDCLAISTGDAESVIQREDMRSALVDLVSARRFCATFYELVASDTPYYTRQNHLAHTFATANPGWEPLTVMPSFWLGDQATSYSINASIAERRPYEDYLRPAPDYSPQDIQGILSNLNKCNTAMVARYGNNKYAFADGVRNTAKLVEVCAYKWTKKDPCLPQVAKDPDQALIDLAKEGYKRRFSKPIFGHQPTVDELANVYIPRMRFELDTLTRLGFSQYFLLVSDLVRWSKDNGIYVGPGRGSVGGSLIAYLTGITDIDPIRFDLLFERFINPDRLDLPDADLDFMSTRRGEVIDYLERRWGTENVAGIVNYNTMGARSAIKDVGRICLTSGDALRVTSAITDHHGVSQTLTEAHETSEDIRRFSRQYEKEWNHALALEGKMRAYGTHAAGIVVAGEPLVNRAVVERRGSGSSARQAAINWDKRVSEDQGLIKLDVLGLSTLDMFDHAIKLIFKRHMVKLDINSIHLDDAETLELFNQAKTSGIFQFEGGSVRRLLQDMARSHPITFDDLVALNALNRPGPLDAGLTDSYIKRRAGTESITYPHASLIPVLESTFGVPVFQEQIMQISRVLCGFTPGEADTLRKIMGKKQPEEMKKQRQRFVDGAVNTSQMDSVAADELFSQIELFAGYAFNKSHSAEYTIISFQAAYLKAHYAVEFYCAQMGTTSDDKLATLVKKAAEDGIRVIPPDINVSTSQFEPLNDTIIASPLNIVLNVSEKGVQAIMDARTNPKPTVIETTTGRGSKKITTQTSYGPGRFVSLEDFQARVPARLINARAIDHLRRVGAFSRIIDGELPSTHPSRQRDQIQLMPAISNQAVVAERDINIDEDTIGDVIEALENEILDKFGEETAVLSHIGKHPKVMFILDAPLSDREALPRAFSFEQFIRPSLHEAGMSVEDGFWTWVIRRPMQKGEREIPAAEIAESVDFLKREVAIYRPPVIVLLGGVAIKQFFPDIKKPSELVGSKRFSADLDATVFIGFKPSQIYHDGSKAKKLTEIFAEVKTLIN